MKWKKSTRSGTQGECVEVATVDEVVAIRDSKDITGPVLVFARGTWATFINGVKNGEFK